MRALQVTPHLILPKIQLSICCCSPYLTVEETYMLKRLNYLPWVKELINGSQDLIPHHLYPGFYAWAVLTYVKPSLFIAQNPPLYLLAKWIAQPVRLQDKQPKQSIRPLMASRMGKATFSLRIQMNLAFLHLPSVPRCSCQSALSAALLKWALVTWSGLFLLQVM